MSGLDVARVVKSRNPDVSVILLTAIGEVIEPRRTQDSGVDLVVSKPAGRAQLRDLLMAIVELRSRRGEDVPKLWQRDTTRSKG